MLRLWAMDGYGGIYGVLWDMYFRWAGSSAESFSTVSSSPETPKQVCSTYDDDDDDVQMVKI
jgi:hypothetical protein